MKPNVTTLTAVLFSGLTFTSLAVLGAQHMNEAGAQGGRMPGMSQAQMQQMQQGMIKMHDLMHQIQNAKTPAERQRLQQQHMQAMQSHMQMMMQGMGGMHGGQGGMMGGGQSKTGDKPAAGADAHDHK